MSLRLLPRVSLRSPPVSGSIFYNCRAEDLGDSYQREPLYFASMSKRREPRWLDYYKATSKRPPYETLQKALSSFDAEPSRKKMRFAIDLGCGGGRDTSELLRRGWKVLAVDSEAGAIRWIRSNVSPTHREQLRTRVTSFERLSLPRCDLVNASYSLPFCSPKRFHSFWRKIVTSIRTGGRFSGHFFGVHDDWARSSNGTFHTAKQVKALLRPFEIEFFLEQEKDDRPALHERRKHWHVFSVVARKR